MSDRGYRVPGTTSFRTPKRRGRRAQQLASSPLLKEVISNQRQGVATDVTTVGAAFAQNTDEFGADAGLDLTQVGPSRQEFTAARRGLRDIVGVPYTRRPGTIGDSSTLDQDDTTLPALNESSIPGTPQSRSVFGTFGDFTYGTPGTPGQLDYGLRTPEGVDSPVELDSRNLPQSAESISLSAAFDAVGSSDAGVLAARGGDRDPVPHMDDYGTALREIKQLLQVLAGPQLAATSEPLESSDGPRRASAVPRAENDGDIWGRLARQSAAEDARDADPTGILRRSNVVGDLQSDDSDESDSDEDDFGDMPTTPPAARDLRELLDAPPSADAPPGAAATSTTRKLDLVARAEAADALRRTPGIMKLIEARAFSFDDFLTDGSLDVTKLAKVRRSIVSRIESTEESYALAARAKGYTPSGAAFPVTGVNNIVAGVRKIPGSKYVMYQGPQYVNG